MQDDPPAAAKADVDASKVASPGNHSSAAASHATAPGFESAAKKEHLSEAEALRRHREEARMQYMGWY